MRVNFLTRLLSAKLSSIIRVGYPNRPPTLIPDIVILDPGLGTFSDSDSLGYNTEAKYK